MALTQHTADQASGRVGASDRNAHRALPIRVHGALPHDRQIAMSVTEVLSERIYRKNGIKQLLTKPRSPPATGKVERWHQILQTDFLDDAGPFATIAAAQAAVDAWRQEYNTARPHQGPVVNGTGRRCVPVPVVTMCLTSTLCLLGERGPDQAALRKRSASAQPGEPVAAGEARTAA
jgi:hypothetical protein